MMNPTIFLAAVLGLTSSAAAHMLLSYPPAFRYEDNPNVPSGSVDYSLTSPLNADGSNFPCKGYQSDMGSAAGASVATWAAGSQYNFSIAGNAPHGGGSCQAALSYDKGKSFTVIHSYMGNCPTVSPAGGSFDFTVPADAPAGAAMFAWTWFNQIGNREIYMDCASVTITGSGSAKRRNIRRGGTAFSSRPSLFVANLGNGCTTIETTDLTFPDPGPDVTDVTKTPGGVTGTCKQVNGIGDFSSGSNSSPASSAGSSSASPPASSAAPSVASSAASSQSGQSTYSAGGGAYTTTSSTAAASYVVPSAASSAATPVGSSSSGLSLSSDGSCGGSFGCQGSIHGNCCSQYGWCGSTPAYCGTGCQSTFGSCGASNENSNSTGALVISTDKTCGGTSSFTCQGSTYGNCCSQYGYCGSTSDYCVTGCQSGFGTCSLSSSSPSSGSAPSDTSISSGGSSSSSYTPLSGASSSYSMTSVNIPSSTSSAASAVNTGFVGVTESSSLPSTFVTSARASSSGTSLPDLITIIPVTSTSSVH